MSEPLIRVENLHKSYRLGRVSLHVLRGVSMSVQPGEFVAIVGASGSGKSTLLHLIGLLDRHDRGNIALSGADVAKLSSTRRNAVRRNDIGFVFQFYHLMEELSVLENVLLPAKVESSMLAWPRRRSAARRRANDLLEQMGLAERRRHRPRELSGGERQRVAIARAMMNNPHLLLADEPTGNLDSHTGAAIIKSLREFRGGDRTLLMVTHDLSLAEQADRILHLVDGRMRS